MSDDRTDSDEETQIVSFECKLQYDPRTFTGYDESDFDRMSLNDVIRLREAGVLQEITTPNTDEE